MTLLELSMARQNSVFCSLYLSGIWDFRTPNSRTGKPENAQLKSLPQPLKEQQHFNKKHATNLRKPGNTVTCPVQHAHTNFTLSLYGCHQEFSQSDSFPPHKKYCHFVCIWRDRSSSEYKGVHALQDRLLVARHDIAAVSPYGTPCQQSLCHCGGLSSCNVQVTL